VAGVDARPLARVSLSARLVNAMMLIYAELLHQWRKLSHNCLGEADGESKQGQQWPHDPVCAVPPALALASLRRREVPHSQLSFDS